MKRRAPETPPPPGDTPLELLAGRCVEVWDSENGDQYTAWRGWQSASDRWLTARGIGLRDHETARSLGITGGAPWSFDFLANHNPAQLADTLARRGLPADWRPTPAPPLDTFGPDPGTAA